VKHWNWLLREAVDALGDTEDQSGWDSEQPDLTISAHCRGVGVDGL